MASFPSCRMSSGVLGKTGSPRQLWQDSFDPFTHHAQWTPFYSKVYWRGAEKCHPPRVASILFRPRQNFEPAFDQELLWIAARALNPAILFPAAHTSAGRTHIFRGRRKGLRARPPDHNGGATHPVDSGKARDPRFGSEFCFPAFPSPAQGACGLHDGRKRTRQRAASGAAR